MVVVIEASPGEFVEVETLKTEWFKRLIHRVDSTVCLMIGQMSSLLQLLPHNPDLVNECMMDEENGVIGRVLKGR